MNKLFYLDYRYITIRDMKNLRQIQIEQLLASVMAEFSQHDSMHAQLLVSIFAAIKTSEDIAGMADRPEIALHGDSDLSGLLAGIWEAGRHSSLGDITQNLRMLNWRVPGFDQIPLEIVKRLAVTEIIGPDGIIYNDKCRFGLFYQRENTDYPNHLHAAEEIYFLTSGSGLWSVDDDKLLRKKPGEFIHHQSSQPHAMVTKAESMLAFWSWTGDISFASYRMQTRP